MQIQCLVKADLDGYFTAVTVFAVSCGVTFIKQFFPRRGYKKIFEAHKRRAFLYHTKAYYAREKYDPILVREDQIPNRKLQRIA